MSYGASSAEIAEDYLHSLRELSLNSRYEISNLTIIAKVRLSPHYGVRILTPRKGEYRARFSHFGGLKNPHQTGRSCLFLSHWIPSSVVFASLVFFFRSLLLVCP